MALAHSPSPAPVSVSPMEREACTLFVSPSSCSSSSAVRQFYGADTVPHDLSDLQRRSNALLAERDHFQQLGERAADAFEQHRRDLTQLAQKERAIRARREDALRVQLQEVLHANRELMTRVVEQRRQQDEAWHAELMQQRQSNAQRQEELETILTELHTERAELQRSVADASAAQEEERQRIAACLEEQRHLQERVSSLRDEVRAAQVGCDAAETAEATRHTHRPRIHPPSAAIATEQMQAHSPPTVQPYRGECRAPSSCAQDRRRAASPTWRTSRRHFVPTGPWDACSSSRASSPATHHVDALLSTIERDNYLRPRLYYQRIGRDASPLAAFGSPRRQDRHQEWEEPGGYFESSQPHHALSADRRGRRSRSQGLSSTTTSSSSTTSATSSSSTATASTSSATAASPSTLSCCSGAASRAKWTGAPAPPERHCGDSPARSYRSGVMRTGAVRRGGMPISLSHKPPSPPRQGAGLASPPRVDTATASATVAATAGQQQYYGSAINSTCQSLIADVARMRLAYDDCQRQLRDPRRDSVKASQEMRRLLRLMDGKADQVRALRREQERHRGPLRVHDVLQQVVADNQYCESVYRDLMELF